MQTKLNKSHSDDHHQPPSDEATRNKIDKHLSDIDDTISEEDIKNINTTTGSENEIAKTHRPVDEETIVEKKDDEDDEPKKEMPTTWDLIS